MLSRHVERRLVLECRRAGVRRLALVKGLVIKAGICLHNKVSHSIKAPSIKGLAMAAIVTAMADVVT